jgi:hypothetical protein
MPILRYKHNGVWTEVAGASVHTHTMADVTDLPSSLPADVVELQGLVGDVSVAEQIAEAVSTKADIGHEHNNTLLYNAVSGAGAIYIPDALADCPIDISVSSDVYTDFSKLSISFVADNYYDVYSPDSNGTVNGLMSKPSFTLTVTSSIANFDATKVTISCTYQYDLDAVMQNYVLDVDDVLNGETGENDYTNNVTTHTVIDNTLSITGAAADAKKTGDEIKSIKNQITNLGSGYTHPDTHPVSMITGLSDVAKSGDYNDLINKPDITGANIAVSDTYDATSSEAMSGKAVAEALQTISISEEYVHPESHPASMITGLATVATSGDYNDLTNKPTIPSIDGLATETYVNEQIAAIDIPEQAQQVQSDWTETDESSPAYIKNKPSISADGTLPVPQSAEIGQYLMVSGVDETGAITSMATVDTAASDWETMENKPFYDYESQVDILPLTKYENFALNSYYDLYYTADVSKYSLTIGETYIVNWDGTDWTCIAQDASVLMDSCVALGDLSDFTLSGNGEPFVIGVVNGVGVQYFSLRDKEAGGSHDIRIYQETTLSKQIDKKYIPIPFFGKENNVVLDYTFTDTQDSEGNWSGQCVYEDTSDSTLVVGETYTVVWNGVSYNCECVNFMNMSFVGNPVVTDGEDNDLPFAIARSHSSDVSGIIGWSVVIITPNDTGVYNCIISGSSIKKVDTQYLYKPDWNENDSSSGSYIANRPFSEKSAGTVIVPQTIINCTQPFDELFYAIVQELDIGIYAYNVEFDGVEYSCTGSEETDGSIRLTHKSDNVEFIIIKNFNNSGINIIIASQGEHTLKITLAEDIINKIDPKYLPSPTSIDLSAYESEGRIVETFADGSTLTTTLEFNSDGKPTKITDSNGNVTTLTW